MATADEVVQRIEFLLRRQGAVPYVERGDGWPAQSGYVVLVLPGGAAAGIEVRHLPLSDDPLGHVQEYRRMIEREVPPVPGLRLMTVAGTLEYKLLVAWHRDVP
jgi:hypothetical protein